MSLVIEATVNIKIMRKVTYQVGVDCLGFPIYVEHYVWQYKGLQDKNERVITSQKTVKQH